MNSTSPFETYYQAVQYLEGLFNLSRGEKHKKGADPEIAVKRMRYLLDQIGSPDTRMKIIHVSGTSGKGTVCSLLHTMLIADGHKAGLYTSPFSTTTIEKIKAGHLYISPQEFVQGVERLKPAIDAVYLNGPFGCPTYYEICFALGLDYFSRRGCEWAVVEVGHGGWLDPTNAIHRPVISVITNVDLDHTRSLGKTLTKIANHKAGIIKSGSAFFTADRRPHILKIYKQICHEKNVAMFHVKPEEFATKTNTKLARSIAQHLKLSDRAIKKGIATAKLPCRFELVQENPKVVLDGAHSPAKIGSLIKNLKQLKYRQLWLILANGNDTIIKLVVPEADHLIVTRHEVKEDKCASPHKIADAARKRLKPHASLLITLDPRNALNTALRQATKEDLIVVTGSIYLTGLLREKWDPETWVLEHRTSFKP
jgi:dihydrofolate synthase/folylpolyglutamate synthase